MRVLLIEDDELIGDGIKTGLEKMGFTIDWFQDGDDGEEALLQAPYDAVILDLGLPQKDGLEILESWRNAGKKEPVLILSARGDIDQRILGLNLGADDYLVKPFDVQEVLLRIRVLLRRNQPAVENLGSTEILEAGEIEIFPDTLEAVVMNKRMKLTPTEFEILYCLMQHFNKAVTLATLLEEVWGYSSDEDVRMLRVHVGALRNKIEPDTKNPRYLHTVTNVGYKLTPFGG